MTPDDDTQPIRGTASFSKFVRVLQCVADQPGRLTVAEIARKTGIPRPSAHRIVAALLQEGMLAGPDDGRGLVLGSRLISLAYRSWDEFALRRIARPALERLNARLDETVHLAVNAGHDMVYVDKIESRRTVRMTSRLGTRVTLYASAVGKAWLAALPPPEAAELIARLDMAPFTAHTLSDPARLQQDIAMTRARGHALDLQERELDICCYGRAVTLDGRIHGCVSISMPKYRFDELPAPVALAALDECIAGIAAALDSEGPGRG